MSDEKNDPNLTETNKIDPHATADVRDVSIGIFGPRIYDVVIVKISVNSKSIFFIVVFFS